MRVWLLAPLGVAFLAFLWTWLANRRPRLAGALWPEGLTLGGSVTEPDLSYEGDLTLGAKGRFGTVRCRTLLVARGADVVAERVEAAAVYVEGRLAGPRLISAGRRVQVSGELCAEEVACPWISITRRGKATVLTVTGATRIERHPKADVKGFFGGSDELARAGLLRRGEDTLHEHPAPASLQ